MRSSGGTKSGEPSFVTLATNSVMDFFAGPSFHEANGSAACALVAMETTMQTSATVMWFCVRLVFIALTFLFIDFANFLKFDSLTLHFHRVRKRSFTLPAQASGRRISAAPFLSQSRAPVRVSCST